MKFLFIAVNGFILDKRELIPIGRETFEGIKVVIDKVIAEDKQKRGTLTDANNLNISNNII